MSDRKTLAFFGSSLLSAYWNGAATYYRGIIRALHGLGYDVTFYEPDIYNRKDHRDIAVPDWARVVEYPLQCEADADAALAQAAGADIVVKASGVGAFDDYLEQGVLQFQKSGATVIFWDVDAPATLDRMHQDPEDPFRKLVPQYDFVFTYGGGPPVVQAYEGFGARACVPIYNALDPDVHFPVEPDAAFQADLAFLGNRLPDREARVEEFFLNCASRLPHKQFLLGGSGWGDKPMPPNVNYFGHVFTAQHNAFNCTPRAVLNISRESMARYGFSPATRVFEAAGAGACIITDAWEGVETFFEPGSEILVARSGEEVAALLNSLSEEEARAIGDAARERALRDHTYASRALLVDEILSAPKAALEGVRP